MPLKFEEATATQLIQHIQNDSKADEILKLMDIIARDTRYEDKLKFLKYFDDTAHEVSEKLDIDIQGNPLDTETEEDFHDPLIALWSTATLHSSPSRPSSALSIIENDTKVKLFDENNKMNRDLLDLRLFYLIAFVWLYKGAVDLENKYNESFTTDFSNFFGNIHTYNIDAIIQLNDELGLFEQTISPEHIERGTNYFFLNKLNNDIQTLLANKKIFFSNKPELKETIAKDKNVYIIEPNKDLNLAFIEDLKKQYTKGKISSAVAFVSLWQYLQNYVKKIEEIKPNSIIANKLKNQIFNNPSYADFLPSVNNSNIHPVKLPSIRLEHKFKSEGNLSLPAINKSNLRAAQSENNRFDNENKGFAIKVKLPKLRIFGAHKVHSDEIVKDPSPPSKPSKKR